MGKLARSSSDESNQGEKKQKQAITSHRAPVPAGAYSQAIRYGDLLFISGIVPADAQADTFTILYPGDLEKQTELVLGYLRAIVEEAGGSLDHILKTTVFIHDLDQFHKFNEIYVKHFAGTVLPARSTVEVGKFNWGMCIEIEAIAAIPQ